MTVDELLEVEPFEILSDPEQYGYKVCKHCNGYGSSLYEEHETCTKCGGLGLIKPKQFLQLMSLIFWGTYLNKLYGGEVMQEIEIIIFFLMLLYTHIENKRRSK